MRDMKDSGLDWITEIPKDWKVDRLKYKFSFGKGLPITKDNLEDEGIAVISYGQVHSKVNTGTNIDDELIRYVNERYLRTNAQSLVHKNDFIFADTSEDLTGCGNCVYVDKEMQLFAGYHTIILRALNEDTKYFSYLFLTDEWRKQLREKVSGVKLFSVTQKIIKEAGIIIPPISEQKKITAYLDKKCNEIRLLCKDIQSQISSLEEYKRSLIFDVVCHGVNKTKFKNTVSDVWTEIPENWDIKDIKYVFEIVKRIAGKEGYDVISVTQRGLKIKDTESNNGQQANDYSGYQFVYPTDYVMNHMDLLTGWVDCSTMFGVTSPDYRVFRLRDKKNNNLNYFKYLMQCCYMCRIFYSLGQGVSNLGRWRLQAPAFNNFQIPVPPKEEQEQIAEYLEYKCMEINRIIDEKQEQVVTLEQYKKSLIYEYVTGKKEAPNE